MSSPFQKNAATFRLNENSLAQLARNPEVPLLSKNQVIQIKKSDPVTNKSQCVIGNNRLNSNIYLNDLHNLNENGFLLLELSIFKIQLKMYWNDLQNLHNLNKNGFHLLHLPILKSQLENLVEQLAQLARLEQKQISPSRALNFQNSTQKCTGTTCTTCTT